MDGNKTVTATFIASQYTLGVSASPVSGGTVGQTPGPPYEYGAVVTLTATPAAGYTFTGWSGDLGGSVNPAQITMDGNKSVTANFAINTYTLTYTAGANGSISGTSPQTVNHGASGTAVTADPAVGYHFVQWSDGSTANPRTDSNVTANVSVTANFTQLLYTLNINLTGNGSVTKNPDKPTYTYGEVVQLTANPAAEQVFTAWSGDLTGTH